MKEKTTREGLPVVDENTLNGYIQDLKELDLNEWYNEIEKENRFVAYSILISSKSYPPEYETRVKTHLMALYKMLKSQAANNKIEKIFG